MDLPCALIVVFWKTFSLFGGYFDFFPDYSYSICWLFGLEDKYFPQGIPGLFWKLVIFTIHIWNLFSWHIFFSLSYIYIYLYWQKCKIRFDFENFVINVAWFDECCMFVVVLKQLRCKAFTTGCIDIWQIYLLFTWLYFRFENHSVFR